MPSHSPELQPAERLWPLINEPIANRSFENLDELEEVLFQSCQALLKQPSLIKGITCFHALAQNQSHIIPVQPELILMNAAIGFFVFLRTS
jgi:hypothetical protein